MQDRNKVQSGMVYGLLAGFFFWNFNEFLKINFIGDLLLALEDF